MSAKSIEAMTIHPTGMLQWRDRYRRDWPRDRVPFATQCPTSRANATALLDDAAFGQSDGATSTNSAVSTCAQCDFLLHTELGMKCVEDIDVPTVTFLDGW